MAFLLGHEESRSDYVVISFHFQFSLFGKGQEVDFHRYGWDQLRELRDVERAEPGSTPL